MEKSAITKPSEGLWRRPRPTKRCSARKEKDEDEHVPTERDGSAVRFYIYIWEVSGSNLSWVTAYLD
jgi:hypothetical protein